MQGENRVLNQTLSLKQADITQLNKDNSRLISELSAAQKSIGQLTSTTLETENKVKTLESLTQSLNIELRASRNDIESCATEKDNVSQVIKNLRSQLQGSIVKIAMLEAGISAKNDIINQLVAAGRGDASKIIDNQNSRHK